VPKPVSVLIVEDHLVLAEALQLVLERHEGLHVVGWAGTVADAVRMAQADPPDVILMDYYLPDGTGGQAAAAIRQRQPGVAVVMLTADTSEDVLLMAVEAGAVGLILKSQAATQVVEAVFHAAEGEMLIPAATLAGLIGRQRERARQDAERASLLATLTQRERETLDLMAQGLDNRAIAERLVVSLNTVRGYVQSVLEKLNVHSKLEAVARASEYGLLDR
jgi:DNA-binding NarL/FixJ family response regulator